MLTNTQTWDNTNVKTTQGTITWQNKKGETQLCKNTTHAHNELDNYENKTWNTMWNKHVKQLWKHSEHKTWTLNYEQHNIEQQREQHCEHTVNNAVEIVKTHWNTNLKTRWKTAWTHMWNTYEQRMEKHMLTTIWNNAMWNKTGENTCGTQMWNTLIQQHVKHHMETTKQHGTPHESNMRNTCQTACGNQMRNQM